ncbi:hypothetical protein [Bacteroides ihuae]|uniref:hypothetical protein n=1 Tax=Bacteroides ihuae TaxID=1852362 RepID=UPI0008D91502|nr:hypothetical protein [Bacteroides ihuae]
MIARIKLMHWGMFVAALLGFPFATMLLWNWLLPDLFNFQSINFWQALGLLVLLRLLFGWSRGMPSAGYHDGMRRKMAKMTPEEREKFTRKIRCRKYLWDDFYQEEKGANSSL